MLSERKTRNILHERSSMYLQLKVDLITNGPVVLVVLTIHHVIFNVTRDYIVNRLPTNDHTVACYVLNTLSNVLLIS